jgi:hypothetical protein
MNTLKSYKIISYVLLPFAGLLAMGALFSLVAGLMNMAFFFNGLMMALTVTYVILSFIFLIRGIHQNKTCNPKMRNWIKTTGFITILQASTMLLQGFYFLMKPSLLSDALTQIQDVQKELAPIDSNIFISAMKIVLYVMIFFATTLIIHYIETMKFLKIYSSVFDSGKKQ